MRPHLKFIINFLGLLLVLNGIFMLSAVPFAWYYNEPITPIVYSALISIIVGLPAWLAIKIEKGRDIRKRDGYLIVTLGWLIMSFSGTLPFILSGAIPNFTDAFFETISGYTTTGSSILNDIESLPNSILLWRSLTQWIGGMGIIVLTIAILPILGIGGMQLFMAEAPGITADKLKPRIQDTATRLWLIYVMLTGFEFMLLIAGGMSFFDSINHSLTTMSTGGFSTRQESIGYFGSPFVHYVIIAFMILGGSNFTLTYFLLKGRIQKLFRNDEFKYYILIVLLFTVTAFIGLLIIGQFGFEESFRNSLFHVVSIVTTTGFVTGDFTAWGPFLKILFFSMMFIGASAGSTAGGVKIVRHIILFKNSFLEMKRQLHPSAIIPIRYNGHAVDREISYNVQAFIMIYFTTFAIGSLVVSAFGIDFETAMGSVASTLGNIGPGIGTVGPIYSYAHFPDAVKWILSFLMLLGRLELFTVLILLTPYFWRMR
jgi:trk system potassium uptake protein TrkH